MKFKPRAAIVIVLSLFGLAACNGGGGTTPVATIEGLYAADYKLAEGAGGTTLTAQFSNGTGTIDSGAGEVTSGARVSVNPGDSTTYTRYVSGGGASLTRSLTVTRLNSTASISPTGALTTARHQHTATLLPNSKVLVAGGNGVKGTLASADL